MKILSVAAESLGANHAGIQAGSFGDAAIVSFNGNKIMTTSGGGMLLTDDPALADHVRFLSTQAREPAAHYEHKEVGYNYRLSNVFAALGRAQFTRLDEMIARRRDRREMYAELFAATDGVANFGRDGDDADNYWLKAIHLSRLVRIPIWPPMRLGGRSWAAELTAQISARLVRS